jgi:hypothetical protein
MKTLFQMIPESALSGQAIIEILDCNEKTSEYALTLSPSEARGLVETRAEVLKSNGRIEFGGGVIEQIITAFYDSPYISQYNYAETLNRLIELFYYFKNETLDMLSDDELISWMKTYFDSSCQGSLELLSDREMEIMAQDLRSGVFKPPEAYGLSDYYDDEEEAFYEFY